jgi:choline dehydrogenase-like flavoprotein
MILEASKELGYRMEPMPKFIDPKKCRRCSSCSLGCKYGAKWTALNFLDKAEENGAKIMYKSQIEKVQIEGGKSKGVIVKGPGGRFEIMSDAVILAAGGLGTPVILQNSGIEETDSNFFVDLLVNTYGVARDLDQTNEPTMALVDHEFYESQGFILSPFINSSRMIRIFDIGIKGMLMPTHGLLGIMTKIRDDNSGRIYPNGTISKPVTEEDRKKLNEGSSYCKEILVKAGVKEKSITISKIQGAHPGGTSAIGRVVDKDLQTKVNNLFVCDSSVLPTSPGMPPILTIAALAKRLAKTLAP